MANIHKRRVRLEIEWSNQDPVNYIWRVVAWGYIEDDSEPSGMKEAISSSSFQTINRTTFEGLTGAQIAENAVTRANDALQTLGSGAGEHTVIDELE